MTWAFNQRGSMFSGDGANSRPAYSGFPPHTGKPEDEALHGLGPIPRGCYVAGTAEQHPDLGPVAIPLTPTKFTDTHGRGGFFIHGDSISHPGLASHGCIITERSLREKILPGDLVFVFAY